MFHVQEISLWGAEALNPKPSRIQFETLYSLVFSREWGNGSL